MRRDGPTNPNHKNETEQVVRDLADMFQRLRLHDRLMPYVLALLQELECRNPSIAVAQMEIRLRSVLEELAIWWFESRRADRDELLRPQASAPKHAKTTERKKRNRRAPQPTRRTTGR